MNSKIKRILLSIRAAFGYLTCWLGIESHLDQDRSRLTGDGCIVLAAFSAQRRADFVLGWVEERRHPCGFPPPFSSQSTQIHRLAPTSGVVSAVQTY
jgi:hypothetical protein